MRRTTPPLAIALALALSAGVASAQTPPAPQARPTSPNCPSDEAVGQLARNLLDNRTTPAFTGMTSLEDGLCAQDKLVRILQSHWGRPVGYKLALTSAPVQQRFGVNHPIRGVIFENTVRLRWDKVRLAHPDPMAAPRTAHALALLDMIQNRREEIGKYVGSIEPPKVDRIPTA